MPPRSLAPASDAPAPAAARRLARVLWLLALVSHTADAQPDATPPVVLRPSETLAETIPADARQQAPVFFSGDGLSGQVDTEAVLEGDAVLRRVDTVIRADRLRYDRTRNTVRAEGHVRLNRAGNVYTGPELELGLDDGRGFFSQPTFTFLKNGGYGEAARAVFLDEQHSQVEDVRYSTCRRDGPEWLPDWVLRASRVDIDNAADEGRAHGGVLEFKGVPILPVPGFAFPLGDTRRSGLLPPTIDLDSVGGFTVAQPYYLNLAPNYDATLTPTLMTRRGVAVGGEFRYLTPGASGIVHGAVMPADRLRQRDRWGLSTQQQAALAAGTSLAVNLNRVSDDDYWRDFTRGVPALTQRLLPADARLAWSLDGWRADLRTLKWQTLQAIDAPIVPPYDRLPQFTLRRLQEAPRGWQYALALDVNRFRADATRTQQPNANRSILAAQLGYGWREPGGFIAPSLRLSHAHYAFDAPLADGRRSVQRALPTFSIDSGLVFERETHYFGQAVRQTLEPRAFYAYSPYRDQQALPVYDTAAKDFNLDSIFSDNPYVGADRVADQNLLTLGVVSRLYGTDDGAERARIGIAQRIRFSEQRVKLPGEPPLDERLSDILIGAALHWDPRWQTDANLQFNPKTARTLRTTLSGRYSPGNYRVVSAGYRLKNGVSELLDLGWQWPLNDLWGDRGRDLGAGRGLGAGRWYSVGRLNYSVIDRKLVDAILGVEYDAGCWIGRVVFDRLQSGVASSSSRIMFQLELVGFSRLGSNPLKTLRDNIPRYQYLREPLPAPSRYTNYD